MNISKNTALIEALLLEDLPDCNDVSEVDTSDEENEHNVQLPTPGASRNFDDIFEEAIEQALDEMEQSSRPPSPIDQASPVPSLVSDNSHYVQPSTSGSTSRTPQTLARPRPGPEPNRRWKKREVENSLSQYSGNTEVVEEFFANCYTPTDIFLVLIDGLLENIVYQSNLFAAQKDKVLNLKKEELLAFIGMNFFMGYNSRPAWKDHFSSAEDLNNVLICKTMPRDRFAMILAYLHCNDNTQMPRNCKDKLYKIRPVVKELNRKFQECYHGTRELSVDESMIKFKGRSTLKQYLPMKPIKRGYKLWCLADQRGFIKKFQIYQGKDEEMSEKFNNYGLGERVVLELTEHEWGNRK